MSLVRNLGRICCHRMKNFFVRTSEEDKQSVNLPRKKEQFDPDVESFRQPWLGTQGPVSGQSRISETGTTAYRIDNFICYLVMIKT